jgi:hypothetical protein
VGAACGLANEIPSEVDLNLEHPRPDRPTSLMLGGQTKFRVFLNTWIRRLEIEVEPLCNFWVLSQKLKEVSPRLRNRILRVHGRELGDERPPLQLVADEDFSNFRSRTHVSIFLR